MVSTGSRGAGTAWREARAGDVPAWGTRPRTRPRGEPGHSTAPERPLVPEWPEPSQSVLAFVLGLVGLFAFPPVAPLAWAIGAREVRAVHQGRRDPRRRGLAQAAVALGIVGTVVLVVAVLAIALVLTLLFAALHSLNW